MGTKYIVSSPGLRTVVVKAEAVAIITARAYLKMGRSVTITPIENDKETIGILDRFIPNLGQEAYI